MAMPTYPVCPVLSQGFLGLVKQGLIDNGIVLASIDRTLVGNLATIDPVLQHGVERSASKGLAAVRRAIGRGSGFADDPGRIKLSVELPDRSQLDVAAEDHADGLGFALVDDELA